VFTPDTPLLFTRKNTKSLDSIFEQVAKTNPVRLVKEDVLGTVPAQHHMIAGAWIVIVRSAGHFWQFPSSNTNMSSLTLSPFTDIHMT